MELNCNKCGETQPIHCCIDTWSNVDGKNYCLNCSKELKIGLFEPKQKKYDKKRRNRKNIT